MKWYTMIWMATFGLACACSAVAQEHLSPKSRDTALKTIETSFQERYVFPELRPKIVEKLQQSQQSGRYDTDDPVVFADRVTNDLRDVSHDRHLSLRFDPADYKAASAPPGSDAGEDAYFRQQAIRNHYGLVDMRILPGNIRYLRITGFEWVDDQTGTAYDEAMRFLKDGDAIVIDLRNNGGGSHAAVRYLVSHFLDGDTLEYTFLQGSEAPMQSRILEHLPAGRLKGKPLYVLINGQTASAAEAFTYDVQQFKLGELIGEKTAGAANNNQMLPVAPYFILSVSFGRPVHAVSQSNWERVGIAPDVETPSDQALNVAQQRALKKLASDSKASDRQRSDYRWATAGVEALLHPVTLSPNELMPLTGRYGGKDRDPIEISWHDGALWMNAPHRPVARLSPMTQDTFAVDGYEALRVRLDGKALEMQWSDESKPRVFKRQS